MPRAASLVPLLLLALASSVNAEEPEAEPAPIREFPIPAYLPRAALVGTYLNSAVTPEVRFQWELTLVQSRVNALVLLFEGGGGYGIVLPTHLGLESIAMTRLYQHTVLAGVGFRADQSNGFHWGGQLATGPLFYGARFNDSTSEQSVWPIVEARAQVGLRFGSSVYGVAVGYAFLYPQLAASQTTPFLGGWILGLFADRR